MQMAEGAVHADRRAKCVPSESKKNCCSSMRRAGDPDRLPRVRCGTWLKLQSRLSPAMRRATLNPPPPPATFLAARSTTSCNSSRSRSTLFGIRTSGASPLPVAAAIVDKPRYLQMVEHFGLTTSEQLTGGCHVHVSVDSDDECVGVLDRIRGWLPVLLALSANSPFWQEV